MPALPATTATSIGSIPLGDVLAWTAIGAFVLAMVLKWFDAVDPARYLAAGAWVVFGLFWLTMVPHYYLEVKSPIQTLLTLAALPLSVYAGYLLVQGRESLLVLSNAVAFMGLFYLPA